MRAGGAYGRQLGDVFGLDQAPTLISRTLSKSLVAVTEIISPRQHVVTEPIPVEDAYLIAYQDAGCADHELWLDGKSISTTPLGVGSTIFHDLRRDPRALMRREAHCFMYYVPRSAFDLIADEAGLRRMGDLRYTLGGGEDDGTIRHLTAALRPAFANPGHASRLFVEHVTLALTTHLAQSYGGLGEPRQVRGGLSPAQERRAKELIDADLTGDLSLVRLAAECGLSSGHFSRAFRRSTGLSPHRWLLRRRVELARDLLTCTSLTLAEIAVVCGFADQSHFTRVFRQMVGAAPGLWRRGC